MKALKDPPRIPEKDFKLLIFQIIKSNKVTLSFKHHKNNLLTAITGTSIGMRYHARSFKDNVTNVPIYYDFYKIALYKGIDKTAIAKTKLFGGPATTLMESLLNPVDISGLQAGTDALSQINSALDAAGNLEGNLKPKLGNVSEMISEESFRIQKKETEADQFEVACNFANVWKYQLAKVVCNGLRGEIYIHINPDVVSRQSTNSLFQMLVAGKDLGGFQSFSYDMLAKKLRPSDNVPAWAK